MSDTSTNQPEHVGAGEEEALSSQIEELLRSVDATLERAARVIEDGDDDGAAAQFAADESDPEIDRLAEEMVAEARGRVASGAEDMAAAGPSDREEAHAASSEVPPVEKESADSQALNAGAAITSPSNRADAGEAAESGTELDESPEDVAALAAEINELTSSGAVKRRSWDDSSSSTPAAAPSVSVSAQDLDSLDEAIAGEADRSPAAEFDAVQESAARDESRERDTDREDSIANATHVVSDESNSEPDDSADRDAIAGLAVRPERPSRPESSFSAEAAPSTPNATDASASEPVEAQPDHSRASKSPGSAKPFDRAAQGSSKLVKMATEDVVGPLEKRNSQSADETSPPAAPLPGGRTDEFGAFNEVDAATTLWSSIKARIEASVPHFRQALGGMRRVLSVMNRPWNRITPAHQIAILFYTTGTITIAIVAWLVVASRIF